MEQKTEKLYIVVNKRTYKVLVSGPSKTKFLLPDKTLLGACIQLRGGKIIALGLHTYPHLDQIWEECSLQELAACMGAIIAEEVRH